MYTVSRTFFRTGGTSMSEPISRRTVLRASAGGLVALAGAPSGTRPRLPAALRELAEKIEAGMQRYGIPGVALGLSYRGTDYVRGFGVTNVDEPAPVDGDTVFRVGSTTKTFTGTAVMRLVGRGRRHPGRPPRSHPPAFPPPDAAPPSPG